MPRKLDDGSGLPKEAKMCNCACCGVELLGDSMRTWWHRQSKKRQEVLPLPVAGRIGGRPYCPHCLVSRSKQGSRGVPEGDGGNPWQQNAVRSMEGD